MNRLLTIRRYLGDCSSAIHWVNHVVAGVARNSPFNHKGVLGVVLRALWGKITLWPAKIAPFQVTIPLDDLAGTKIYEEIFLEGIYDIDLVKHEPDLILDFGAHMGMFAILAGRRFPNSPILCFEPSQRNLEFLRRNIRDNKLNAVAIPLALDSVSRSTYFEEAGFGGKLSSASDKSASQILTVGGPDLLGSIINLSVLVKMDIEGAEEWILPALLERLPLECSIFLETHQRADRTDELLSPFSERGFNLREIRCRSFDGVDYKEWFLVRSGNGSAELAA